MNSLERLAVSTQGMRELHAGRPPWSLAKELVQNSWDEAPAATVCTITVEPLTKGRTEDRGRTVITVTDDGPGFRDIADAYTLMGPTPKRVNPTKRGRFNVGEKEIISVASEATIETVGRTVVFPSDGGRGGQAQPSGERHGGHSSDAVGRDEASGAGRNAPALSPYRLPTRGQRRRGASARACCLSTGNAGDRPTGRPWGADAIHCQADGDRHPGAD